MPQKAKEVEWGEVKVKKMKKKSKRHPYTIVVTFKTSPDYAQGF